MHTTLDVQHAESLDDVAAQVTTVRVREPGALTIDVQLAGEPEASWR